MQMWQKAGWINWDLDNMAKKVPEQSFMNNKCIVR